MRLHSMGVRMVYPVMIDLSRKRVRGFSRGSAGWNQPGLGPSFFWCVSKAIRWRNVICGTIDESCAEDGGRAGPADDEGSVEAGSTSVRRRMRAVTGSSAV